jgi:hypothetical protein
MNHTDCNHIYPPALLSLLSVLQGGSLLAYVLCDKILLDDRVKVIDKEKGKEKEKEEKRLLDTVVIALTESTAAATPHSPPPPLPPVSASVHIHVPVPGRKGPVTPPLPQERTEVEVESIPQVCAVTYCASLLCNVM